MILWAASVWMNSAGDRTRARLVNSLTSAKSWSDSPVGCILAARSVGRCQQVISEMTATVWSTVWNGSRLQVSLAVRQEDARPSHRMGRGREVIRRRWCNPVLVATGFNPASASLSFLLRCLIALMIEAACTSETSVNLHQTTRRNIPEDSLFILDAVRTWNLTLTVFGEEWKLWMSCIRANNKPELQVL
jgi:hypothetical protein